MNEQRFEWCADGIDIWDNLKQERIDYDFPVLLNNLYEENEQLRKALWEAEESYIYERYEWSFEIEEELEELKKKFERRYWQEEDEL